MNFLDILLSRLLTSQNRPNKEPTIEGDSAPADTSREAHQAQRDLSRKREAREAALATLIAEIIAREIAKANREICMAALLETLKILE